MGLKRDLLPCSLHCKEDNWPLNSCTQSRQPRRCLLSPRDASSIACRPRRCALAVLNSSVQHLIMRVHITVQREIGLRRNLSSKFISTLQAAAPSAVRHCTFPAWFHLQDLRRGDTSFLLCCLKVMPFVMYCTKLELISCCCSSDALSWGAGTHGIRIYAKLLFVCSVKTSFWGTCEKTE